MKKKLARVNTQTFSFKYPYGVVLNSYTQTITPIVAERSVARSLCYVIEAERLYVPLESCPEMESTRVSASVRFTVSE